MDIDEMDRLYPYKNEEVLVERRRLVDELLNSEPFLGFFKI